MRRQATSSAWQLERTRCELLIDWSAIADQPHEAKRQGFAHVIRQCATQDKDEFVIRNIVPGYVVGKDDPAVVVTEKDGIASIFQEAALTEIRTMPPVRMGLRRGEFDLRFYLGRTRPTDHDTDTNED